MIHQDDEFTHDGGEGDFGGFAGGTEPLVKRLELAIGMGGDQCGHVKRAATGSLPEVAAKLKEPLTADRKFVAVVNSAIKMQRCWCSFIEQPRNKVLPAVAWFLCEPFMLENRCGQLQLWMK